MRDDELDLLLHAMASQPRRAILAVVRQNPGCNVGFLASQFSYSRIGVMKHLAVVQAANLVLSQSVGRERKLFFNPNPLQQVFGYWSDALHMHALPAVMDRSDSPYLSGPVRFRRNAFEVAETR